MSPVAKRKAAEKAANPAEGENAPVININEANPPESQAQTDGDQLPPVSAPPQSEDVSEIALSAAQTITGCTDNETKNFIATCDWVIREVALGLADIWKEVCVVAEKTGKEGEKAAKATVGAKIVINHTNIQLMDTKLGLRIARATKRDSEWTSDLRQTSFKLTQ